MARNTRTGRTAASTGSSEPAAKSTAAKTPSGPKVRVPTGEDLEQAKSDALLQLRIGRSAHYYSILVAVALLFDAALVLYVQPNITALEPAQLRSVFFLLFPLIGAVFLAILGIRVKWETYQLWPWEGHFWTSLAAVLYNGFLTAIYFASLFRVGPTAGWSLLPWFYPAVLGGLSLALVGLALTWTEWTQRKTVSVVSAILPVPFAAAVYALGLTSSNIVDALALSLSAAGVLYLVAGGFLHIISSGTRTHEREVISSGQTVIFQLAEEVKRKEDAFRFREATLLKREADAEDLEASLKRKHESLELAQQQLTQHESELQARSESLRQSEGAHATQAAEARAMAQAAQDKEAALLLREKDLEARMPPLAAREQKVTTREAEQRQREVELAQREQETGRRQQGIPEAEANLERRRQDLERRTAEVLQRESVLRTREASGGAAPAAGKAEGTFVPGGIEDREARLTQLKMTLDEQNLVLGRRARQVDESLKDLLRREQELSKREAGVTQREGALSQREADAKDRFELGESRRQQYEGAIEQYQGKLKIVDLQTAEVGSRKSEMERQASSLAQREQQMKEREQQLGVFRTSLDRLQRVLAERQKALEAKEDQLALERQRTPASLPPQGAPAPIAGSPVPETLAPPVAVRHADREPSGTPRLDDLLQGGLPSKAHVLLIGDAFVGKEVALYAFLAEGLKRGEPAIIVTTSRGPEEVAQQIGLVTPQFKEYEQLGKVVWVDASRPAEAGARSEAGAAGPIKGPDDHAGILSAVVAGCRRFEGAKARAIRVGFVGLTASLAHVDDRGASVFLQNFVGILKPRSALAMYTLEAGALPDARVEGILSRMDGVIRFRQERDKTFLQVAGIGDVETREWIECRATNRALVIGSFTLERIR